MSAHGTSQPWQLPRRTAGYGSKADAGGAKCATVALLAFDFDHARLQAQLAGRLGCCIALLV
jgi:hypothetical protein